MKIVSSSRMLQPLFLLTLVLLPLTNAKLRGQQQARLEMEDARRLLMGQNTSPTGPAPTDAPAPTDTPDPCARRRGLMEQKENGSEPTDAPVDCPTDAPAPTPVPVTCAANGDSCKDLECCKGLGCTGNGSKCEPIPPPPTDAPVNAPCQQNVIIPCNEAPGDIWWFCLDGAGDCMGVYQNCDELLCNECGSVTGCSDGYTKTGSTLCFNYHDCILPE